MYYKDSKTSPRVKEMRRTERKRKLLLVGVFFACTLIILSVGVFIVRLSDLQIQKVVVTGTNIVLPSAIEQKTLTELSGNYFFFIPKSSVFFYGKKELEESLRKEFPRLKDLIITTQDLQTLTLTVTEHTGMYLWCGETYDSATYDITKEECSYVDDTGYVFDTAPSFSGNIYLKFFGGLVKNTQIVGEHVLPEKDFNRAVIFATGLQTLGFRISGVVVTPDTYTFLVQRDTPPYTSTIVIKSDAQVETLLAYVRAAITTEPLSSKLKKSIDSLEYLDLRFNKKVYYKFTEDQEAISE
jgi:hypothetical protein